MIQEKYNDSIFLCWKRKRSLRFRRSYFTGAALFLFCSLLNEIVQTKFGTNNITYSILQASIHVVNCILKKAKRKHPKVPLQLSVNEAVREAVIEAVTEAVIEASPRPEPAALLNCDGAADLDTNGQFSTFNAWCRSWYFLRQPFWAKKLFWSDKNDRKKWKQVNFLNYSIKNSKLLKIS